MNTVHNLSQIQAESCLVGLARHAPGLRAALLALVWPALLLSSHAQAEETQPTSSPPAVSKPATAALPQPASGSSWHRLGQSQRQALAPLAAAWDSLSPAHKRKWLALSQNFSQLSTDEQATLQGRMREWTALSPQKRTAARLNFAGVQKLPQEDKKAKWEAYQALSPEAKQKLAAQQPLPVAGAAPTVKPLNTNKLVTPPPATGNKPLPRIATGQLAPVTLLPATILPSASAPASAASAESTTTPQ
jgi:hypothetical protein